MNTQPNTGSSAEPIVGSSPEEIRQRVSTDYAAAVARTKSAGEACCAPSCCGETTPGGVAAKLAGYVASDLGSLPVDAVVSAFGCGDPVTFAAVEPGQVVVDLGSGAGIDLLLAAKKVGPSGRVIGIDMTDEMIERAEKNIRDAGLDNVEVRKGLIEAMPVDPESVDWVISNCVINLSPEKERVFAEIARVLKPGGHLVVSDIVARDLPAWMREDPSLYCGCISGAIDEEAYLQGLRDAGLTDVAVAERFVYEGDQIEAFVASEITDGGCGCGGVVDPERAGSIVKDLAGNVWSARFTARKPE